MPGGDGGRGGGPIATRPRERGNTRHMAASAATSALDNARLLTRSIPTSLSACIPRPNLLLGVDNNSREDYRLLPS